MERHESKPGSAPGEEPIDPAVVLTPTVAAAKRDFDAAMEELEEVEPGYDPENLESVARKVARALDHYEEVTDPENPEHVELHAAAVKRMTTRLREITGEKPGPFTP